MDCSQNEAKYLRLLPGADAHDAQHGPEDLVLHGGVGGALVQEHRWPHPVALLVRAALDGWINGFIHSFIPKSKASEVVVL